VLRVVKKRVYYFIYFPYILNAYGKTIAITNTNAKSFILSPTFKKYLFTVKQKELEKALENAVLILGKSSNYTFGI
jgi:hypothetical protein